MKPFKPLILIIFFFLISPNTILSQDKVIDSLKKELAIHVDNDSTKVILLNDIAYKNYGISQDELIKYADKANLLSMEIGFTKGEAKSLYLKGLYYLAKRDLDSATTNINKSLNLEKENDNANGIAKCYNLIATVARFHEDYDKSISDYNKALLIYKNINKKIGVANVLSNIGAVLNVKGEFDEAETILKESIATYDSINEKTKVLGAKSNLALVYTQQGRHTEALGYFQKCLTGYRENGDKIFGAAILLNIALVYSSIDENDKALPYLKESLELNKELENELEISKCLTGLGYTYRYKKEYDKALDYYNQGLKISEKINSKVGLYNCYSNIATLHIEKEEFDLALKSLKKGLKVSLDIDSKRGIAESYYQLGIVYNNLGNNNLALENALKGKKIADELSLSRTQREVNLLLSKLYEKKNNYKEALEKFKEHKMYSDSLFNKENVEKVTQLEYEYKYKQALDSASLRELKLTKTVLSTSQDLKKSQRNLLLGVIVFLAATLFFGTIIFLLKLKNEKSKTQNIAIEQKLLRSQMTPHFIFNSLSVLQGMILNKEDEKSIYYLSKFSKLLRITLENSRDKMTPLQQELEAVNNYLELQNLEENQAYQYTILVDDRIDTDLFEIPPMLIQPFIENAIEHAFKNQIDNRKIDVELKYSSKKLICTIQDNGIGIDTEKTTKNQHKNSLATTITSERLKMLSSDFKTEGSVMVENRQKSNERGTIVTLVIPYIIKVA